MTHEGGEGPKSTSKKVTPRTLAAIADTAERQAGIWLGREVWWRQAYYVLLVLSTVLAAVAGATAIAGVWSGTLAGVLALTASALTAAAAVLRPSAMAIGCGAKAAKYFTIAREARRADEDSSTSVDAKRDTYYTLLERYDTIRTSPEPALPTAAD